MFINIGVRHLIRKNRYCHTKTLFFKHCWEDAFEIFLIRYFCLFYISSDIYFFAVIPKTDANTHSFTQSLTSSLISLNKSARIFHCKCCIWRQSLFRFMLMFYVIFSLLSFKFAFDAIISKSSNIKMLLLLNIRKNNKKNKWNL